MANDLRPRVLLFIALGTVCFAVYTFLYNVTLSGVGSRREELRHGRGVAKLPSSGSFTERVAAFNAFLTSLKAEELTRLGNHSWQRPNTTLPNVVLGARDDYLQLLSNHSNVMTIALPWLTSSSDSSHAWSSLQDYSNLLIQTYYEWTADDRLCSWIETPGKIKMKYDAVYNRRCNRNINDTVRPVSLEPLFLNGKPINSRKYWPNGGRSYPTHFYTATPPYVFHMHIHRDAIVTGLGVVITDFLKLVLYTCGYNARQSIQLTDNFEQIPLHKELYVINQHWGNGIFHRMVEVVPRLVLNLQFLKANPEIRILGPQVGGRLGELLEIIGLNKSRLVTGVARAKIVYQPRATGCGLANVQESQVLSKLYRDYIKRTFPRQPRNRLILIRRSRSRRFTEQKAIEEVLERAAKDYNLTYTLFIDNPTPSLNDTMMMFHSAVVIVAPHGAGLSNMYFSQPGTYVVEGVCNLPHVNMCYQWLAHILGHHWHGVTSRGGCEGVVDVSAASIHDAVRSYLSLRKLERS